MATLFRALVFQSDSEENTNISYIPKTDLREGYQVLTLDFQHPCFQRIDHVFLCLCLAHKVLFQCIIVSLCHIYIVYHKQSQLSLFSSTCYGNTFSFHRCCCFFHFLQRKIWSNFFSSCDGICIHFDLLVLKKRELFRMMCEHFILLYIFFLE